MKRKTYVAGFVFGYLLIFLKILYFCYILLTHGDTEVNSGPKSNCSTSFSCCHWNLNSVTAHNYIKLSSLQMKILFPKCDPVVLYFVHQTFIS